MFPHSFIIALVFRAGAVGINLAQANCVFLMEPCFNSALEAQVVGRVHCLGQKRSVDIVRLVMEESVEVRIREMLEKKYGSKSEESDTDGDEEDKKLVAKPAVTPLVGSIVSDKAAVMEDISTFCLALKKELPKTPLGI